MPFELTDTTNDRLIHANPRTAQSFAAEQLSEDMLELNLPFADARVREIHFDGIRLVHQQWQYREKAEMAWKGDLEMVTLYFNLKGSTAIDNPQFNKPFELGRQQHNLFYAQTGEGTIRNEALAMESLMIQFHPRAFIRLTEDANEVLKRFSGQVLEKQTATLGQQSLSLDAAMLSAIHAILHCPYQKGLKKMFLLSKCMELLVLQAEAYEHRNSQAKPIIKTAYDQERIRYAREYLLQHIDAPPSLTELAREAGVNEYKLKKGFKELFGNTVFGYLSDIRLGQARIRLSDNRQTPTEIAYELGYGSVQHFSNAFKKHFGVAPGKLRSSNSGLLS